jgi:hypothetical protein
MSSGEESVAVEEGEDEEEEKGREGKSAGTWRQARIRGPGH